MRLLEEWRKKPLNYGTARQVRNWLGPQLRGGRDLRYVEALLEQLVQEGKMEVTVITERMNRIGQYASLRKPIVLPEDRDSEGKKD